MERCKVYFEKLFRVEASVQGVANWEEASFVEPNSGANEENEIEMDEIVRALRSMKIGKAVWVLYNIVSVKMLKSRDGVVASLL